MRIGFRTDAGRRIGGGHVMRCLSLAEGFAAGGDEVVFLSHPESGEVVPALGRSGFAVLAAPGLAEPAGDILARHGAAPLDLLVVDHYRLSTPHERTFRPAAGAILVIDDLADRPHDCDLLVDAAPGREAQAYAALAPRARLLLGSRYAMLRSAFAESRPGALARREGAVRRVLLSFGLADPGGVTARAARALLGLDGIAVDAVVGPGAASRGELERMAADGRLALHVDPPDMPGLMAAADLAVGGGGVSVWERCCLGLPSVTVVLADNQRGNAAMLSDEGAGLCLEMDGDFEAALAAAVRRLLSDPAERRAMGEAAARLCDGQGVARIIAAARALPQMS